MKRNKRVIYLLELLVLIFIVIFEFIVLKKYRGQADLINIVFWALLCFFVLLRLHFPQDKNYQKRNTTRLIIISLMSALLFVYGMGILLGFTKTIFAYNFLSILKNIVPVIILIISEEIVRYIIAKNSFKDSKPIILITILFVILNIIIEINYYNFYNFEQIFKFICVTTLPLIAREMLYSYTTFKVSLVPTLLLRISLEIYPFIFPIYPSLGDYFVSIFGVTIPFAIYGLINRNLSYGKESNVYVSKIKKRILSLPIVAAILIIICLVSGLFTYKMIAIGSNSMVPIFARGDAVVYTQFKGDDYLKANVGDILAFKRNNTIITHRIVRIYEVDNVKYFKTKGDANEIEDTFEVPASDALGIINYRVPYIGLPTIWLSESMQGSD